MTLEVDFNGTLRYTKPEQKSVKEILHFVRHNRTVKGAFMRNFKQFITVLTILAIGLLTACGNPAEEPEAATVSTEPVKIETAESILYFNDDEGSAKLVQYFEDGNVPEEATFLYDQMGSNPEITITDPETIRELYRLLSMVTVSGETNESITDCYHYVQFKLAEDCYIRYSFEGSEIWCYGKQNYSIENSGKLFKFMGNLTREYIE